MAQLKNYHKIISKAVRLVFMVLFVYAGTSKILDFETFKFQLERSPYIMPHAAELAWGIPSLEYLVAVLLLLPRYSLIGLYTSLGVILTFTGYIYIVLNYSNSVPCSCGGLISTLSWTEHLQFNLLLIVLTIFGILISHKLKAQMPENNTT